MSLDTVELNYLPAAKKDETKVAGQPRLIIRTCRHILESDKLCRQPAVRGRKYCRAHILLQVQRRSRARAHRRNGRFRLPPRMDLQGVQAGLARVQVALDAGHIESGRARSLRSALRLIASCTRSIEGKRAAPPAEEAGRHKRPSGAAKSNANYELAISCLDSRRYVRNTF